MVYPLPAGPQAQPPAPALEKWRQLTWGGTPFPLSLVLSPSPLPFLILGTPSSLSPSPASANTQL